MYPMSNPNNSNDYPSYGGYSSYGGGQNSNNPSNSGNYGNPGSYGNYGNDAGQGYGQNPGNSYPPTSGYVNPELGSESGRPLQIPPTKLSPAEPIAFGFKRFFTSQWHVYLGLMFLPFLIAMVGFFVILLPQIINDANSASGEISTGLGVSMAIWYVVIIGLSLVSSLALTKAAVKDTRGVKPTWQNAFKDVPWGNGILVYVLLMIAMIVVYVGIVALGWGLAQVSEVLAAIVVFVAMIGFLFLYPFAAIIPLYAIDRKTSAIGAFGAAWKDVKAQYWQVLGALILTNLAMMVIVMVTFGFGALVIAPVQILATVFIYRWISEHGSTSQSGPGAGPNAGPGQPYQNPGQPGGYMSMY